MQYRAFDSLTKNLNDYWGICNELCSSDIYDKKFYHEIVYIIFNKEYRNYTSLFDAGDTSNLSRFEFFCRKNTFPHELFRNFSLQKDDWSKGYRSIYNDNSIIVSSPAYVFNYSHHIVFFDIAHISLFPDEVIPHFLYRLDIL